MCKFCKLEIDGSPLKEKTTAKNVLRIKNGYQVFELYLRRYVVELKDIHESSLEINTAVILGDGEHTLATKEIPIKYCPFCGKEL